MADSIKFSVDYPFQYNWQGKAFMEEQKQVTRAYSSSDDWKEEIDEEQQNIPNTFKKYTI